MRKPGRDVLTGFYWFIQPVQLVAVLELKDVVYEDICGDLWLGYAKHGSRCFWTCNTLVRVQPLRLWCALGCLDID